jgi:hypothetical protein
MEIGVFSFVVTDCEFTEGGSFMERMVMLIVAGSESIFPSLTLKVKESEP